MYFNKEHAEIDVRENLRHTRMLHLFLVWVGRGQLGCDFGTLRSQSSEVALNLSFETTI